MEHIHTHTLDLSTLYSDTGVSAEEAIIRVFHEVKRSIPSILYIPNIDHWWNLVPETVRAIFMSMLMQLHPNSAVLILATSNVLFNNLPESVSSRYILNLYLKLSLIM